MAGQGYAFLIIVPIGNKCILGAESCNRHLKRRAQPTLRKGNPHSQLDFALLRLVPFRHSCSFHSCKQGCVLRSRGPCPSPYCFKAGKLCVCNGSLNFKFDWMLSLNREVDVGGTPSDDKGFESIIFKGRIHPFIMASRAALLRSSSMIPNSIN
jgi:hypothetical protein